MTKNINKISVTKYALPTCVDIFSENTRILVEFSINYTITGTRVHTPILIAIGSS